FDDGFFMVPTVTTPSSSGLSGSSGKGVLSPPSSSLEESLFGFATTPPTSKASPSHSALNASAPQHSFDAMFNFLPTTTSSPMITIRENYNGERQDDEFVLVTTAAAAPVVASTRQSAASFTTFEDEPF